MSRDKRTRVEYEGLGSQFQEQDYDFSQDQNDQESQNENRGEEEEEYGEFGKKLSQFTISQLPSTKVSIIHDRTISMTLGRERFMVHKIGDPGRVGSFFNFVEMIGSIDILPSKTVIKDQFVKLRMAVFFLPYNKEQLKTMTAPVMPKSLYEVERRYVLLKKSFYFGISKIAGDYKSPADGTNTMIIKTLNSRKKLSKKRLQFVESTLKRYNQLDLSSCGIYIYCDIAAQSCDGTSLKKQIHQQMLQRTSAITKTIHVPEKDDHPVESENKVDVGISFKLSWTKFTK